MSPSRYRVRLKRECLSHRRYSHSLERLESRQLLSVSDELLGRLVKEEALNQNTELIAHTGLRTSLGADEGFLQLVKTNNAFGAERSGYTAKTSPTSHPLLVAKGEINDGSGYDVGNTYVVFSGTVIEATNGINKGPARRDSNGALDKQRTRAEYEFVNTILAQIGLTAKIKDFAKDPVKKKVSWPLDSKESKVVRARTGAARGDEKTIPIWYVSELLDPAVADETKAGDLHIGGSTLAGPHVKHGREDGILIPDKRNTIDTLTHELGHYLLSTPKEAFAAKQPLNGVRYLAVDASPLSNERQHPIQPRHDIMNGRRPRPQPLKPDEYTFTSFATKDGSNNLLKSAPASVGPPNGNLGPFDQIAATYYLDKDGNWQKAAGEPAVPAGEAMLASIYVQRDRLTPEFGDWADLKWVEDNSSLDVFLGGDSEFPDRKRNPEVDKEGDWLYWSAGNPKKPESGGDGSLYKWIRQGAHHVRQAKYGATTFNTVDVFSQIARYADRDIDPSSKKWSAILSAIDYEIEFLVEIAQPGGGTVDKWVPAELGKVFRNGWFAASLADDFVARWTVPDGDVAKGVRLRGRSTYGGDGNTQIDAIVAGNTTDNISIDSCQFVYNYGTSSPTLEYHCDYTIDSDSGDVPQFSIGLYVQTSGGPLGEPFATIPITNSQMLEDGPHTVIFSIDMDDLQGVSSLVTVVNNQRDVTESRYSDNTFSTPLPGHSYGFSTGSATVGSALSNPDGVAATLYNGETALWAIDDTNAALTMLSPNGTVIDTFTLTGNGVAGGRDWRDLAAWQTGPDLFIADLVPGSPRNTVRVLKLNDISPTCGNIAEGTGTCEYSTFTLSFPASATINGVPNVDIEQAHTVASTLLVDPYDTQVYVITETGPNGKSLVFKATQATQTMQFVAQLPIGGVIGGDVSPFLGGTGGYTILKTSSNTYILPFRDAAEGLHASFTRNQDIWVERPSGLVADDIAIDPAGNGYYLISDVAVGSNPALLGISHSEPSPVISDARFTGNGEDWEFEFTGIPAHPFHVSVYRSTDGISFTQNEFLGTTLVEPATLDPGANTITIAPGTAHEPVDYKLVALVGGIRVPFSGGAFRSNNDTLLVSGSDASDLISVEVDGDDIVVSFNGETYTYTASTVPAIQVRGQDGSDIIVVAVPGIDARVFGGADGDVIDGSLGQGTLIGGDGDDVLIAGSGIGGLWGNNGDDTYVFTTTSDRVVSILDFQGTDTLDFSRVSYPIQIDLTASTTQTVVPETNYRLDFDDTVIYVENVIGTDYDDVIIGNHLNNVLSGGLGADTYYFVDVTTGETLGSDTIDEFAEIDGDTLDFSGLTATMLGSAGVTIDLSSYDEQNVAGTNGSILKLTLTNPLGVDNVVGTAFADSIIGNDGDNVLEGGAGNDTLAGGGGSDTYVYSGSGVGSDAIIEADVADSDTLDFSGLTTTPSGNGITVNLLAGTVDLDPFGGNISISSPSGIENVIGTTGDDTITGNARANRIEGGLGDDTLAGGRGDDTYVFARETGQHLGLDVIREFGNVDHDTLDYSAAKNARLAVDLSSATNQDVLYEFSGTWVVKGQLRLESIGFGTGKTIEGVVGTDGNDLIVGNVRPNRLEGRGGNDTLDGHNGQDSLGGGDDTYVFARVDDELLGEDEIVEGSYSGYDTLDFSGMNVPVSVDLQITQQWQEVVGNLGSGIVLKIYVPLGSGGVSMPGVDSIEHIIGSPYDDTLRGNTLANHIRGGLGDDTIEGRGGNDVLDGGEGSDLYEFRYSSMVGGLGDDILREGEAADSDTLDFSEFYQAVSVNLSSGATASGVLNLALNRSDGVENVIGTLYGDTLLGNARPNLLIGGAGNDSLSGFEAEDTLEGGEGNDTLDGGAGSDVFRFPRSTSQNLGSDSIIEAADVDSDTLDFSEFLVSGSDGVTVELNTTVSDTIYSGGLVLTLSTATSIENAIGSPGDDTLEGNSRDNILEGRGGDDHLNGYSGNDTYVFSRTDVDDLGSDTIADTGGSLDTIDLSRIDLELDVTPDYGVEAGKFEYTVNLGTIEVLIGGALDDALSGDGAWLIGGPGNDTLVGGSGSDTLEGGEGDDSLIGGGGNDVYRFRRRFFEDLGVDRIFEEIGEGTDLLDFSEFDEALYVDLATKNQQRVADRALELILLLGDDTSRSEVEDVVGGDFDDVLIGNELGNHLFGGAGDDTLEGGEGNDSLEGGVGDDTYVFRQFDSQNPEDLGEDIVSEAPHRGFDLLDFSGFKAGVNVNLAASGMNNIDPTNGNLSLNFVGGEYSLEGLIGTDYADTLTGNKRPNWLEGGQGDDTLSGDLGDDRYVFRVFGSDDLGTDVIQNEVQHGGRDVIDFADFRPSDGLGINGTSGFNLGTLSGSTAQTLHSQLSIRLHTTAVYLESVVGTPFADRLIGNNYANILFGGDGNDTLEGGLGNDTLFGDGGDDSLVGGDANDTYVFDRTETDNLGHDTIVETASAYVETLDFSLFGQAITVNLANTEQTIVAEILTLTFSSATAIDNVIGTPFHDTLRGNSGNNVLAGGAGDDRYVFSRSSDSEQMGSDTITDTDGNDTLDFSEFGEGVFTALYNGVPQATNQFQVNRAGSSELTLQVPANQIENVIGSSGDDDINGIGGGTLFGGDGDDTLNAIGDDATLIGGDGDDFLNGDNYRVTLEGGLGNDTLNGEAGDTTYVFARESTEDDLGHDEIIGEPANEELDTFDFSGFAGSIVLDLNGGTGVNVAAGKLYLTFGSAVIENVIGTAGADTITGNSRPNLIFGGDGADTISGGGGHDTLIGEAGNDSLLGGDGDDVLEGGTGNDALVGGDGNDAYVFAQTNGENLGSDSITETTNGGDEDALMFNAFGSGVEVYLYQADTLPIVSHGSLTLTLVNRNSIERLEGSEFDDILFADSPDKAWLYGHAGNDVLYAGDATEALLYGGLGDDWLLNDFAGATTMYGGEGNDRLVGGEHSDDLYGGPGDDELVSGASGTVDDGAGHDIVDGQPDNDPSIGSTVDPIAVNFILDPSSQVERGAALSLSLSPVLDSDGIVLYALYYWDADDDGVLNLAFDRLVGSEVVNGTGVASEVSISTAGLPLGDARFFARVVDSHGLFSEVYEETIEVVDAPPRVQKVYVSSTEWTSEFYSAVGITSMGYFLTTGFLQLRPLPWINVNQIHIQFTKDVIVDQGDFHLYGVNVSEYAIAGFSYDASTYTATWTLVDFLGIDKLRIYLSDDVTDIHGNRLDGEAPSGSNVYPSGNGTAGGVFTFRFNSLPGDVSSSVAPYSVSQTDVNSVSSLRGWTVYATSYSSRADLDGNGIIDEIDYILVQQLNPSVLPSGEPGP